MSADSRFVQRDRVYVRSKRCLALLSRRADNDEYWDEVWRRSTEVAGAAPRARLFSNVQKRYEPNKVGPVLEAGCGDGRILRIMLNAGYQVCGVDSAAQTIERLRASLPEADVRLGDVRALPLADASIRSYWSVGVIEHFPDGYDAVVQEASRVLMLGGHAFVSFPHMSAVRTVKVRAGSYRSVQTLNGELEESFNQYCLRGAEVRSTFARYGLKLVHQVPYSAVMGLIEDVSNLRRSMINLHGRRSSAARAARLMLELPLRYVVGHSLLQVFQKLGHS
jgi:SAM-dependent methyltransferase